MNIIYSRAVGRYEYDIHLVVEVVNTERKIRARRERNHFRFRSKSGWRKTGPAHLIIVLLTSAKHCLRTADTKICLQNEIAAVT